MKTKLIYIILLLFVSHVAFAQTFDYLKSATSTGSGTTIDNSKAWTDLFSVTIDLGSNTTDTKYVLVTASINMRPEPNTNTQAREGNYNIYRSGATSDSSGIIKRQIKANNETGVASWGIGTLVHIFDVSSLSGSVSYTLEHSNQGGSSTDRNVFSSARLTAVALSTATNHYELSNDIKRLGETGVTTTSATYAAVTGLTTDSITLPIKGDIYVTASVNGKANGSAVAEYKLQYSSDGGSNWADLGKPIKRSMVNTWDDGIVSLVGLLQDQVADNDFKFRVAHKRESGSATVTTHNCNLVAIALSHDNGGYFPTFYSEVGASGVDIIGLSAPAATVTSTTFTAAADISSTGTNLFVNTQYLVNASNLDGIDRMRAGNLLKVSGASSAASEEYYRYIPDNANFGAGGGIGLMEDLVSNGSYTIAMDHQIAALSGTGGSGDETLNTSEVILTGFQTYDQYPTWNGSSSTDFNTASNWSNNTVPSSGFSLFFADNPDRSCYLDTDRTIGAIGINQSTDKLVVNGHNLTINGTLDLSNGGQIDATTSSSTLILESSLSQNIPDGAFYNNEVFNLTINNSNNIQLFGTLRLLNNISSSSGRIDVTTNSSTFVYAGTSAQTIESSIFLNEEFYNLTIDNSTGVTLNTDFAINNNLIINSGKLFTLSAAKNLSVNGSITNSAGNSGFILNSDATGTASLIHNTNDIPATVQRYVSGNAEDWHFLSSPVSNQSISGSWLPSGTYGNGTGYDLYLWNESNSCWIYKLNTTSTINWNTVHPGSNFEVGRGYLYSVQATTPTKEFAGNLNNGTINYGLTYNGTDASLKGFNLVGNPYPSTIDWKAAAGWTRTQLTISGGGYDMWIWNPAANNYGVYNSADTDDSGTNSVTRYIAATQGYFVLASGAGNMTTTNSVRLGDATASWFKKGSTEKGAQNMEEMSVSKVCLSVKSDAGYGSDEIQLKHGYSVNKSSTLKLFSSVVTAPSLYINSGAKYLSVNYLTDTIENPYAKIMFTPGKAGKFTIDCNFNQDDYETVILEDLKMNYTQNMKTQKTYSFTASVADNANRFVLHFGPVRDTAENGELPARVYSNGTHLIVDLTLVSMPTDVFVYDLMGKLLLRQKVQGKTQHNLTLNTNTQILIVYLKNPSGSLTKKIFLKKY
jgi:hypothetical protein